MVALNSMRKTGIIALLSMCMINHLEFSPAVVKSYKTNSDGELNAETLKHSFLKSQLSLWSFLLSARADCF